MLFKKQGKKYQWQESFFISTASRHFKYVLQVSEEPKINVKGEEAVLWAGSDKTVELSGTQEVAVRAKKARFRTSGVQAAEWCPNFGQKSVFGFASNAATAPPALLILFVTLLRVELLFWGQ